MARITYILPGETNLLLGRVAIEQDHGAASVLHLLGPDFQVTVLADSAALAAQRILVYRDHFLVVENVVDLWLHVAQIVACNQGRREDGPQAEVGAVLLRRHAPISHFEHVRIVPVTGPGVTFYSNLQIQDIEHAEMVVVLALPLVANVTGRAPQIPPHLLAPEPRLGRAPLADAQHNRPACRIQGIPNERVRSLRILRRSVAPVVLQVIDAPGGVLQRILIFMAQAAGTLRASFDPGIGVDPKLESPRM